MYLYIILILRYHFQFFTYICFVTCCKCVNLPLLRGTLTRYPVYVDILQPTKTGHSLIQITGCLTGVVVFINSSLSIKSVSQISVIGSTINTLENIITSHSTLFVCPHVTCKMENGFIGSLADLATDSWSSLPTRRDAPAENYP